MLVFEERRNWSTRRTSQSRVGNQQTQPRRCRIWTLATLVGEASAIYHHCVIPVPLTNEQLIMVNGLNAKFRVTLACVMASIIILSVIKASNL